MARLTAEQLGAQVALAEREVDLPELGGTIRVRALTVGKRARLRKGLIDSSGGITNMGEFEIRMFVAGVCDPPVTREQALIWKDQWSGAMWDRVILAITEVGGDSEEVERVAAEEFQDSDE